MRTDAQKLAMNRSGKPDVGQRPTLDDDINVLRDRISRLTKRMRVLAQIVKNPKTLNIADFEEFGDVNKKLRQAKIDEAEVVYVRNIL